LSPKKEAQEAKEVKGNLPQGEHQVQITGSSQEIDEGIFSGTITSSHALQKKKAPLKVLSDDESDASSEPEPEEKKVHFTTV
jgi:hypothetical protein